MEVDFLVLTFLAENGPLLDRVELELYRAGDEPGARRLFNLQKDASIGMDEVFSHGPTQITGPQTEALTSKYEPLTVERLNSVMRDSFAALDDRDPRPAFGEFLKKLEAMTPPPSTPSIRLPKPPTI